METLFSDLRAAFRSMAHGSRSVWLIPLCLALGLGANATMFGVTDTLFFRAPAHVGDPGRLTRLYFMHQVTKVRVVTTDLNSYPHFADLRDSTHSFENVAAYTVTPVSEGRGASAVKLRAALVSATYFPLLQVPVATGRLFAADEMRIGGAPAAVISDALWRSRYGASKGALGQTLRIAGREYPIVGVAPWGFIGVDAEPADVWILLEIAANDLIRDNYLNRRGAYGLSILGRLKPGVTRMQAQVDAGGVFRNSLRLTPGADTTARTIAAPFLRELGPNRTDQAKVAIWLGAVSIAVLLIAVVNCTNLMLLRALRRRREFAVRLALGSGRARLARLLLTENVLLSLLGAVAAVGVGFVGSRLLHGLILSEDATASLASFARVLTFAFAVALAAGVFASLPSLWIVTRGDLTQDLRAGVRAGFATRSPLRASLLTGQVALTVVLLIGAGLFVRSLRNVRALDLGFDPSEVVVVNIDFVSMTARAGSALPPDVFYHKLEDAARTVPGVTYAAVSTSVPFQYLAGTMIAIPGRDTASMPKEVAWVAVASEDYQRTLGLRLVAGRWFEPADYGSGGNTVVINQTMAKTYWPGESAVGHCFIQIGEPQCRTVVGVTAETRVTRLTEEHRHQIYVPEVLDPKASARLPRTLVVRSSKPRAIIGALRRAMQSVDPTLAYVSARPLNDLIEPAARPWRLGAMVFAMFGVLALVLAGFGLYGTMNYAVSERTHELAVRIALGAGTPNVLWLVLRRSLLTILGGLALGIVAALLGGSRLATLLFAVSPKDATVFVTAGATLAAAALAACYSPLRRATRVDPMSALRQE
jgi:putative ABC transport system permease protein